MLKCNAGPPSRCDSYMPFTLSTAFLGDCWRVSRSFRVNRSIANHAALRLWRTPSSPLALPIIVGPDHTLQLSDALLQCLILLLDFLQLCLVLRDLLVARGAEHARAAVIAIARRWL